MKYNINKTKSGAKTPWTNRWSTLLLLVVILVLSAKGAWNSYSSKAFSGEAALEKQEELEKLEARQAYLTEQLRRIETAEGREAVFREDFGLGKPDEQLAIIVETKSQDQTADSGNKIWHLIKNFFAELFKK